MKTVFFLVALANVALFMWEYNKSSDQAGESSEAPAYPGRERIVLASELERNGSYKSPLPVQEETSGNQDSAVELSRKATPENQVKEPAQSGEANPVKVQAVGDEAPSCYEAGPFTDSNVFAMWQKQLSAVEAAVKPVSRAGLSVSDYLVYFPSANTPEQAMANLKRLRDQGHTDAWVMSQGDQKGGISLGVFKKEERALAMRSQLLANGIHVEIMPRHKSQMQKFALIKGGRQVEGILSSLEKTYPDIAVKSERNCSEP